MTCNAADRDVLKDGIIGLLKPVIDEIDARVTDVRKSQVELRQHLDSVADAHICYLSGNVLHIFLSPLATRQQAQQQLELVEFALDWRSQNDVQYYTIYTYRFPGRFYDDIAKDLRLVSERQQVPIELEPYVKKLNNARRRLMLVNNILQNAQERLNKLHCHVSKETARRKALLDPPPPGPAL